MSSTTSTVPIAVHGGLDIKAGGGTNIGNVNVGANIFAVGTIEAAKNLKSAQLSVGEVLSVTSGPIVVRAGVEIRGGGNERDVNVVNGNVKALNVSVQGNLDAPFGFVNCAGVVCGTLSASGKVNVRGDVTVSQGSVRALNVFVEGNLEAPFGHVNCAGSVSCDFVFARVSVKTKDIDVTGDIRLANADCAEEFELDKTCAQPIAPGMVMVLGDEGRLRPSSSAYDKRVAGVVSGGGDYKPGIILGNGTAKADGVAVALLGRVACHVDATHESVEVGDLLTTSDTPGYAMKASDSARAFGAVIGKALRPLRGGKALVPILVALQ